MRFLHRKPKDETPPPWPPPAYAQRLMDSLGIEASSPKELRDILWRDALGPDPDAPETAIELTDGPDNTPDAPEAEKAPILQPENEPAPHPWVILRDKKLAEKAARERGGLTF